MMNKTFLRADIHVGPENDFNVLVLVLLYRHFWGCYRGIMCSVLHIVLALRPFHQTLEPQQISSP